MNYICIDVYRTRLQLFKDTVIHTRTRRCARANAFDAHERAQALHVPTVIRTDDRFSMNSYR